jgi:hypothetical protein
MWSSLEWTERTLARRLAVLLAFFVASLPISAVLAGPAGAQIVGVVSPYTGQSETPGDTDGSLEEATFWNISAIAADGPDLFLAVYKDNSGLNTSFESPESWLREVDTETGQVSTLLSPADLAAAAAGWTDTRPNFALEGLTFSGGHLYIVATQCGASLFDCTGESLLDYDVGDGELSPFPVTSVPADGTAQDSFEGIATDGTSLYVTQAGCAAQGEPVPPSRVLKIPIGGGAASTLWSDQEDAQPGSCSGLAEIAYDEGKIFATDRSDLFEIDASTGLGTSLLESPALLDYPQGLAVSEGTIFVSGRGAFGEASGSIITYDRATASVYTEFAGSANGQPGISSRLGIGVDNVWFPGAIEPVGEDLYVADRDPTYTDAWAHLLLRKLEILPDSLPPTGSAESEEEVEPEAPVAEPPSMGARTARLTAAGSRSYPLRLQATDTGEGREPSGVRFYQARNAAETSAWLEFTTDAAPTLLSAPTQVRFRDRAGNESGWVPVERPTGSSAPGQGTGTSGTGSGGGSGTASAAATPRQGSAEKAPASPQCVVPRLARATVAVARRELLKAHCRIGRLVRREFHGVRSGRVAVTRPGAGKKLQAGAKVNLVVAKAPR